MSTLSFGLEGTHVLITGGSGFIGSVTVDTFLAAGANVTSVDLAAFPSSSPYSSSARLLTLTADITSEDALEGAFATARERFGVVQVCVALASLDWSVLPHHASITEVPLAQWQRTFRVNVEGTFLTARAWLRQVRAHAVLDTRNIALVIVGSESGWHGERSAPDYACAKSAVQVGLVQSLKGDVVRVHPRARVNAINPGTVDTPRFRQECEDDPEQLWSTTQATTALKQPVPTESVAKSILYLASEEFSGHVTGQMLNVDSGKHGVVMWNKDE